MSFVYAIAFSGGSFLMVYNPKRQGWEMPGGRMEPGESPEQAVVREFLEETGQGFRPITNTPFRDGQVFAGDLMLEGGQGEMEWKLFRSLPDELAFPEVEYLEQLRWAEACLGTRDRPRSSTLKS
jgi:8-oxo-dGTP diphosphatase